MLTAISTETSLTPTAFEVEADLRLRSAGSQDMWCHISYLSPDFFRIQLKGLGFLEVIRGPEGLFRIESQGQRIPIRHDDALEAASSAEGWLLACRCIEALLNKETFRPSNTRYLAVPASELPTLLADTAWVPFSTVAAEDDSLNEQIQHGFVLNWGSMGVSRSSHFPLAAIVVGTPAQDTEGMTSVILMDFTKTLTSGGWTLPGHISVYGVVISDRTVSLRPLPWLEIFPLRVDLDVSLSPADFSYGCGP
jgi:hypothetical protein